MSSINNFGFIFIKYSTMTISGFFLFAYSVVVSASEFPSSFIIDAQAFDKSVKFNCCRPLSVGAGRFDLTEQPCANWQNGCIEPFIFAPDYGKSMVSSNASPSDNKDANKPQDLAGDAVENDFNNFYGLSLMIFAALFPAFLGGLDELRSRKAS